MATTETGRADSIALKAKSKVPKVLLQLMIHRKSADLRARQGQSKVIIEKKCA